MAWMSRKKIKLLAATLSCHISDFTKRITSELNGPRLLVPSRRNEASPAGNQDLWLRLAAALGAHLSGGGPRVLKFSSHFFMLV